MPASTHNNVAPEDIKPGGKAITPHADADAEHPSPKRVILRLSVNDFTGGDPSEYTEAIFAYLDFAGRATSELDDQRHFPHIEPFQDFPPPAPKQKRFHITLDMEQDQVQDPDFGKLPHEIYRVRRDANRKFQVKPFNNLLEAENIIEKARRHMDILYPWGDPHGKGNRV